MIYASGEGNPRPDGLTEPYNIIISENNTKVLDKYFEYDILLAVKYIEFDKCALHI